jgi:carbonic anhydrase/acetyltransferase-like protein (isoleucine patch superfamily)
MSSFEFRGLSPVVSPGTWLAPTATLVGDVRLDEGASVWFGAVIRADTAPIRIGAGTNIQDNCVLHTDAGAPLELGRNISVGHSAVLHGCTVEDDVLVGMGAMILNGALIGAGSLVAAGALVTAGTQIPTGSLVVGAPAKVVRPMRDDEIGTNKENARLYSGLAREWQAAEPETGPVG